MDKYLPHVLLAMVALLVAIVALLLIFGLQHVPPASDPYEQAAKVLREVQ
jgi:hypothetical protein